MATGGRRGPNLLGGCVNPWFFALISGHHANQRLYTPRPLTSPFVAPVRTALGACLPQDRSDLAFWWPSVSLSCEPPFDVAHFTPFRHRRLPAAGYLRTRGNVLKQQKKKNVPKGKTQIALKYLHVRVVRCPTTTHTWCISRPSSI